MSDTTTQECICCQIEADCINGLCENCSDYNYKLQKQSDLLTLGLLQEKQKSSALLAACRLVIENYGVLPTAERKSYPRIAKEYDFVAQAIAEAEKD